MMLQQWTRDYEDVTVDDLENAMSQIMDKGIGKTAGPVKAIMATITALGIALELMKESQSDGE